MPCTSPKNLEESGELQLPKQLPLSLCGMKATPIALGFGVPREHAEERLVSTQYPLSES